MYTRVARSRHVRHVRGRGKNVTEQQALFAAIGYERFHARRMTETISADAQENILQRFLMRVGVMQRISECDVFFLA